MSSTNYNKLIIQVSLQNFSFCVKNQLSNEILHFKSLPINTLASLENQLETIFNQHELLQVSYEDVLVLHDNSLNTFIPEAFFNEHALGSYLQYNTKVFATDFFTYDDLEAHEMKNVFVPYVAYNNFFIDHFGAFTYKHIHTNLVEFVLEETKKNEKEVVYVHLDLDHFDVIVSKNGTLQFFNSFEFQTPEDFIYYILFVLEQLKLDVENVPLYLFGNIQEDDQNYQIAYNYVRNVSVLNIESRANMVNTEAENLKNNFILIHS